MSLIDLINQQRAKLQRGGNNRPERLHSERNLVRVLPSWTGNIDDQNWQNWGQHFVKDKDGALKAVYVCTQTCFDEECAVCEAIAQGAAMTSDEDILRVLKDSRSSRRMLINALYLKGGKHDNPETNPVVLDLPPSVLDSIFATYLAYKEEDVNVFDLAEGINFIIEKTGTGMATEYKVTPAPKATKIDPRVMEKVQNLNEWARQESEAEKAKAVTTVRVLTGSHASASTSAPRLASEKTSRLADVTHDAVDADFVDISTGDSEIDDFLKDL